VPLFMLRRKYFDLIAEGRKDVELRRAEGPWKNAKYGDRAVLMCGRAIRRKKISAVHKGNLSEILSKIDYRRILPDSISREEAVKALEELYPKEEEFIAFELSD